MRGAILVEKSQNAKLLGSKDVAATYTSIEATCPPTCPYMGNGCYAELGHTGIASHRMDKEAKKLSPLDVARAEAHAIVTSYRGGRIPDNRDLRLHVAGDSRTIKGTRVINKAVGNWKFRGGGDVWSFTHAWKHVPRSEWSNVSILASVSDVKEAKEARAQGYAPALVVGEHRSERAYELEGSDIKWIPCPNQTRGIGCTDCRLCFNADRLFSGNFGIAFAAHGVKKNELKRHLTVIK